MNRNLQINLIKHELKKKGYKAKRPKTNIDQAAKKKILKNLVY